MDLQQYKDEEIMDIISSVKIKEGKSKDSGNIYYYVNITFVNGYEKRLFLNNDERFAWLDAISSVINK